MKRIDWNRLVPLGIEGEKVRNKLLAVLGVSAAWTIQFFTRFANDLWNLYYVVGAERILRTDLQMEWFSEQVEGIFLLFGLTVLCMPVVALMFYLFHYQGSKSIYTMRRLPDGAELWRRCLALPVCCAAACLVLSALLLLLYYGFYHLLTPKPCLVSGQWQHLWEEWLCWN